MNQEVYKTQTEYFLFFNFCCFYSQFYDTKQVRHTEIIRKTYKQTTTLKKRVVQLALSGCCLFYVCCFIFIAFSRVIHLMDFDLRKRWVCSVYYVTRICSFYTYFDGMPPKCFLRKTLHFFTDFLLFDTQFGIIIIVANRNVKQSEYM